MPKSAPRTYSRYSKDAVHLLANLISVARKERQLTMQELADRVGISRGMLNRIEKGDMKCEIGVVFEVASVLGIPLFQSDAFAVKQQLNHAQEKLALLPKSVRRIAPEVRDDF